MKAAPLANPREKAFDIVIVENQPFLKKYWLLCLMAFGKHTKMDGVTMFKAKDITFYTKDKIPFHADGEIMGTTPFRLGSSPSPLRIKHKTCLEESFRWSASAAASKRTSMT